MKFSVSRDALIKPLNLVAGVVERRQTLPILSNVLLSVEGSRLSLTGTDLEVELVGRIEVQNDGPDGDITVPARKLVDICKSLPDGVDIAFSVEDGRATVKAGRSRFTLSTLPAAEFPTVEAGEGEIDLELAQTLVRQMIDRTGFAMAQQDVRYYLNGMYMEIKEGRLRFVATDGHRLALCTAPGQVEAEDKSVIVPRKGILELSRLLDADGSVTPTLLNAEKRPIISAESWGSKLPVGSSAIRILGLATTALAIPTRCCSPPDKASGEARSRSSRPTLSRAARTLRSTSRFVNPAISKGKATL